MILALLLRRDGSEGFGWHLRGLFEDGRYYGEVLLKSRDPNGGAAISVSGRLSPEECVRMKDAVTSFRLDDAAVPPIPHFAALFVRSASQGLGESRRVLCYNPGDEVRSEPARALLKLIGLLEPHLAPACDRLR